MTLLHRIAISNGNIARQADANRLIADMNRRTVEAWHRQLEMEIQAKARQERYARLLVESLENGKELEGGKLLRRRLKSIVGPIRIEPGIYAAFRPLYGRLTLAIG
jgi:hypothetical protein